MLSGPLKGKPSIFRQTALDRLSSPEQLDQLMQVTTPRGWIALIVLGVVLVTALVWGIFGSISTKINGTGILIRSGGLTDVVSRSSGVVMDIFVDVGDVVPPGQVLGRIGQPDLEEKIANARANLKELRTQYDQQASFINQNIKLQLNRLSRERTTFQQRIEMARKQLEWLSERITNQEQLLEKGLITRQSLLSTQEQYDTTQNEINQVTNQLSQIEVQELEIRSNGDRELMTSRFRINEAERDLRTLEDQLVFNAEVVTTYGGRIVEVTANVGDLIQASAPIVNLEIASTDSEDLAAVIYVPLSEGKKVRTGMSAQISPTTVKREEYGFMRGALGYVSAFPATRQGMLRVLANDQLVQTLSAAGPPIAIYANLTKDPNTLSGYAWSSGNGPATIISSGTLCVVSVVVDERRPISLVIPYVKKQLGMGTPEL